MEEQRRVRRVEEIKCRRVVWGKKCRRVEEMEEGGRNGEG